MTPILLVLLCAAAVAGLLRAEQKDDARLRGLFKPAASAAFVLAALASGALETPFGAAMFTGLVLSALGDVLLIARGERWFLAGMAAFGLGHLAYSYGFILGGLNFGYGAGIAGGLTLAAGLIFLRPMRGAMGPMSAPVGVYVLVISAMVAFSVAHFMAAGTDASFRLAAGAAAFAASDLSVARDQFHRRAFINRAWGLPLYYGAQCLIALSV